MTNPTSAILSALALAIFALGVLIGRWDRKDRRVTRERPMTLTPSLKRQWRSDRLVREVGNRYRR